MKRKVLPWLLVILWMALIFYLSHQPATKSNGLSKGATEIIVETVGKVAPKVDINKRSFNHIIRKNAMFEVLDSRKEDIKKSEVLERLGLEEGKYFVVSAHREENINSEIFKVYKGGNKNVAGLIRS